MAVLRRRGVRSGPGPHAAQWVLRCVWIVAAGFLCTVPLLAQSSREYQVKAVFLFNFAQFVEWPPDAFESEGTPLTIGVLGSDPFRDFLDQVVANEKVRERNLAVERYRRVEDIKQCHILFISQSESAQVTQILRALQGRPILTVSDMDAFVERGGMIRFFTESRKIRFQINVNAARAERLIVSSKLLRLAEVNSPPASP